MELLAFHVFHVPIFEKYLDSQSLRSFHVVSIQNLLDANSIFIMIRTESYNVFSLCMNFTANTMSSLLMLSKIQRIADMSLRRWICVDMFAFMSHILQSTVRTHWSNPNCSGSNKGANRQAY